MKRNTRQKAEFNVKVACDAVGVIRDLDDQGRTEVEIREMFAVCDDARRILDSMMWRMSDNWTHEERERTVKALLMMADYVQNTRNPKEMATDAWVVETQVLRILDQFSSYENYEGRHYNNPLCLVGFASFITEACGKISGLIARGYDCVTRTSEKRLTAEWNHHPYNKSLQEKPDKVYAEEWTEQDIYRLSTEAREAGRADDKKEKRE